MSAFDDGRPGVWHTSIASFKPTDTVTVAGYRHLGIKDIWQDPYEVNPAEPTVDGKPNYMLTGSLLLAERQLGFNPQLYIDGTHTDDGAAIAKLAHDAITRLNHSGAIQFNIERPDDWQLARTCAQVIQTFRGLHSTFVYGLNVVSRKAFVIGAKIPRALPDGTMTLDPSVLDLMRDDPFARLRVQQTRGNMEGEANLLDEVQQYVFDRNFPWAKLSFTFAVKGGFGTNVLPGFFRQQPDVPITRGDLFNANLLRQFGLA